MKQELISIIIPIYNVEEYLMRCISSVLNQTYKNIEIILVDDGSKDNSGKICDKYQKNKNFTIIHKQNGGLSDARNKGIEAATGKYLYFLDSDDYICKDALEILYQNLKDNNADIACAKELFVTTSNINTNSHSKNIDKKAYSNEEALAKMLYMNGISNSACNKLYKKELFNNIRFPVGELFEDLGTIYKVIGSSKKVVCIDEYLYNYYYRTSSITHQKFSTKNMITLKFSDDIINYVHKNFPNITSSAIFKKDMEAIMLLLTLPKTKFKKENKEVLDVIKKYNRVVIRDKSVKINWKISCYSVIFGRYFLRFSWKLKLFIKKILNFSKRRRFNHHE